MKSASREKIKIKTDEKALIKALLEISKAITSELYLKDILKLIVTVTAKVMNSEICSLMLIDEKKGVLRIEATQSMVDEYNLKPPVKLGEGIAGKVALESKPATIYDILSNPDYKYKDIAKKLGLKSLLCVPLVVKGKVIGVINCYTIFYHEFSESEVSTLQTVANQSAVVIENANLLVTSNVLLEELETRKLVERAKGILMKEYGMSEEEAHRRLQKQSMNTRKPLRTVAEAIVIAREIES
ncbi:MAG: GAF and ANTAR domain-containing protein [Elusimicrobiota bacterium]